MTPLHHSLAHVVFRNLPQSTAKEAQASWRLAEVIAAGITEELARMARVDEGRPKVLTARELENSE